jgi:hypothetical protein
MLTRMPLWRQFSRLLHQTCTKCTSLLGTSFGMPVCTARTGLKVGVRNRQRLKSAKASNSATSWNISRFHKGRSPVTGTLREKVVSQVGLLKKGG